jgi:hypothetical protein
VGVAGDPPPLPTFTFLALFSFFLNFFPSRWNSFWIFHSELFLALLCAALFLANVVDEPMEVNLK